MKNYLSYFGYFFVGISIYFLVKIFVGSFDLLHGITVTKENMLIAILSISLYLLVYLILSYSWLMLLRDNYPHFNYVDSISIIGRSQIGKYLPGNIGHFVGRLVLLPRYMSKKDVSYTLYIENIVMVFSYIGLGCFYYKYFPIVSIFGQQNISLIFLAFLTFSLIAYTGFRFLRKKYEFLKVKNIVFFKIIFLSFITSFIGGLIIYLIIPIFNEGETLPFFQCASGFALSFLAGFIIPGAPGGVGIREFAFILLFGSSLTDPIALEVILSFRLVTIIGDILLFGATYILNFYRLSK